MTSFSIRVFARAFSLCCTVAVSAVALTSSSLAQSRDPNLWFRDSSAQDSLEMEPVRENATTRDGLRLALKHYPRPGAQPVLLVHGLAQNDRIWDPKAPSIRRYSFARYLHAQGFDVWVGNMRAAGTPGFRSDTPPGPHHWTIDDYAVLDMPALIEAVTLGTRQRPFVAVHSLAAWALEGYLAGATYTSDKRVFGRPALGRAREELIRGFISIAGVHNLHWEHSVRDARAHPIRTVTDFYHSNYELELMSMSRALPHVVPNLPALPLDWINTVINVPIDQLPFFGPTLRDLYIEFQHALVHTPLLNMFYYAPGVDQELVRMHGADGMEDLGPRLIEQLSNAVRDKRTSSHYHIDRPRDAFDYGAIRERGYDVPVLFVGGGRDRMASSQEIYEDGYVKTRSADKTYVHADLFGHMDILNGINAPREVMDPVARWIRERM